MLVSNGTRPRAEPDDVVMLAMDCNKMENSTGRRNDCKQRFKCYKDFVSFTCFVSIFLLLFCLCRLSLVHMETKWPGGEVGWRGLSLFSSCFHVEALPLRNTPTFSATLLPKFSACSFLGISLPAENRCFTFLSNKFQRARPL
jgi:hypothetical protein